MVKENYYYLMNQNMKEISKIMNLMGMENLKQKLIIIMEILLKGKRKEKENMKIYQKVQFIKESLMMIKKMDMGKRSIVMALFIKGNLKMDSKMEKEF